MATNDYDRFIGLPPRKKRAKDDPAIEAWGSDEDILPGYGLDLSPEAVGTTDAGEPITMDEPRISRTARPAVEFGPTTISRGGRTSLLNAPESRVALTQVAADGAAPSPLLAQLEAIQGPASALGHQSAGKLYQDYIAAKGGFTRAMPTVEAAKGQQEAQQRDEMERLERQAQGAADTSKATSSDGEGPNTAGIYRQAMLDELSNVGRALRGQQLLSVRPEEQARAEMRRWLASKAQREAEAGRLAQQERLAQMQAMLGLSKEQAATERAKLEAESREKVAQIGAEQRKATAEAKKPVGGPVAPKPPKAKEPRELPPAMVAEFASYDSATDALDRLLKTFEDTQMHTLGARASAIAAGVGAKNTAATPYLDEARAAMQGVGTILEGGKLAAGDEAKYAKMLPQPGDSVENARKKIANVKTLLTDKRSRALKDLSAAGYKTPGAAPAAAGKVLITNGTETLEIDADDLPDAEKDGYKRVAP